MTAEITRTMYLQIGRKRYHVASFKEASDKFCAARDASGNGASRTPSPLLVDDAGAVIGHVSYNGRVWVLALFGPIGATDGF